MVTPDDPAKPGPAAADSPTYPPASRSPIQLESESAPAPVVAAPPQPEPMLAAALNQPRRADRLTSWLALLVCLPLGLPAMLIGLDAPQWHWPQEARTIATSIQTWRNHGELTQTEGFSFDRYEPYLNGRSQLLAPPGLTWLHMAVFANTSQIQAKAVGPEDVEPLILRARLVSVGAAVFLLATVFWAGYSVAGLTAAFAGVLVCAANPMFIFFARMGTATMPAMAMSGLATAAALWAIRPLKPSPSVERQFLGWLICGLAMGAAILTHGLWALLELATVILLLLVLCPRRLSHLLGLLAALLIGVLLVAPWGVYTHEQDADAWRQWLATAMPGDLHPVVLWDQLRHRLLWVALVVLPWPLWLIAAAVQPFSTSSAGSRTRLVLGLVWFASLLCLELLGRLGDQHTGQDLLPLALRVWPAAAVLIGLLFAQFGTLADEGRSARLWRFGRWGHILLLAVASGAIPALLYVQDALHAGGLAEWLTVAVPPWQLSAALALVLMILVLLSVRWAVRQYVRSTLVAWAVWTLVLLSVASLPATARSQRASERPDTENLVVNLHRAGANRLFWLDQTAEAAGTVNAFVLLYAQRDQIDTITPAQLVEMVVSAEPFQLIAAADTDWPALTLICRDQRLGLALWQHAGQAPGG